MTMWIVRLALQRPYTFIVLALLLLILGIFTIFRTPTDILPNIDLPVVSVVWQYNGLPPEEMADRITSIFERAVTTTVYNIEHIESQSLNGVAVVKIFFQPSVRVDLAVAQVTAISQTLLRTLPPGTTPPFILAYNASSVPVMQLVLSSHSRRCSATLSLWRKSQTDSSRFRSPSNANLSCDTTRCERSNWRTKFNFSCGHTKNWNG
jgi:multidrug efflux pump subunit AcrB